MDVWKWKRIRLCGAQCKSVDSVNEGEKHLIYLIGCAGLLSLRLGLRGQEWFFGGTCLIFQSAKCKLGSKKSEEEEEEEK